MMLSHSQIKKRTSPNKYYEAKSVKYRFDSHTYTCHKPEIPNTHTHTHSNIFWLSWSAPYKCVWMNMKYSRACRFASPRVPTGNRISLLTCDWITSRVTYGWLHRPRSVRTVPQSPAEHKHCCAACAGWGIWKEIGRVEIMPLKLHAWVLVLNDGQMWPYMDNGWWMRDFDWLVCSGMAVLMCFLKKNTAMRASDVRLTSIGSHVGDACAF